MLPYNHRLQRYVTVGGSILGYRVHPSVNADAPAVVFVGGRLAESVAELLSDRFPCISVDLRGLPSHGRDNARPTVQTHALRRILESERLVTERGGIPRCSKPILLAGYSEGLFERVPAKWWAWDSETGLAANVRETPEYSEGERFVLRDFPELAKRKERLMRIFPMPSPEAICRAQFADADSSLPFRLVWETLSARRKLPLAGFSVAGWGFCYYAESSRIDAAPYSLRVGEEEWIGLDFHCGPELTEYLLRAGYATEKSGMDNPMRRAFDIQNA